MAGGGAPAPLGEGGGYVLAGMEATAFGGGGDPMR